MLELYVQKNVLFNPKAILPPTVVLVGFLALWVTLSQLRVFPPSLFPSLQETVRGGVEIARTGELLRHVVASLYRVALGFLLSAGVGIPLGLILGRSTVLRSAFLPAVNFLRNLSPIAWIPFAILWIGIGDNSVIFLIFMAATFPIALTTLAAVGSIPSVYFRVASEYGLTPAQTLTKVTLPAILPQVLIGLRVAVGLSWVVMVAAEMIAGKDGLGYLIHDARNNLRTDLLVVAMALIGLIGVGLDRLLTGLTKLPSVRWGYSR